MYAGEQLISEIAALIGDIVPAFSFDEAKNKISAIVTKYNIQRIDEEEVHPDLHDKVQLFISSKKLEGLSPLTLDGYRLELGLFVKTVKKLTKDITAADIRSYLAQQSNVKMSTIGRKLSVIKSFFGWLAGEEIISRDPASKLKPPKTEKRLPKALTIEELELLRESCQTVRQRAFIEILYATGCRLSEIHQLNRKDINVQSMSTNVIGKGNKEREVYLSYKAMYHLKKYLNSRTDDSEALMVSERQPYGRLSKRGIQREIKQIAKNAGLESKVSPHVLRHTFATLTLNNGAELVAVQELLGHSSPDTTLRYAKVSEERKRQQHKQYLVM